MANDRASSAGYGGSKGGGYGFGGGPGRGKSTGGPSIGSKDRGSPRTKGIPDKATYRMGGAAEPFSNAIAGYFQKKDINERYADYNPSPPHGGMTRERSASLTASGKMSGPGKGAKGSPRTRSIGSKADYEKTRVQPRAMDYVPSAANKAVTGKFFASDPEFRQARDIKEAYRDYKASPAHRGMRNAEVSRSIEAKESRRGRD